MAESLEHEYQQERFVTKISPRVLGMVTSELMRMCHINDQVIMEPETGKTLPDRIIAIEHGTGDVLEYEAGELAHIEGYGEPSANPYSYQKIYERAEAAEQTTGSDGLQVRAIA